MYRRDDLELLILPCLSSAEVVSRHHSKLSCLVSEDRKCLCSLPHPHRCLLSQELEKLGLGDSVDLHVYEIPVEYQTVQRLIPALWEKHSPQVSVLQGNP